MMIKKKKQKRFIEDGPGTFFHYELKNGSQWRKTLDDLHVFDQAYIGLNKEIRNNVNARKEELFVLTQIQEHKNIVWMEGMLGWTAWVDILLDILQWLIAPLVVFSSYFVVTLVLDGG